VKLVTCILIMEWRKAVLKRVGCTPNKVIWKYIKKLQIDHTALTQNICFSYFCYMLLL